jgi:hypothetical protein
VAEIDELESVVDKTISTLQSTPALRFVKEWHKVNGFIPSKNPAISVGFDSEHYEEYTQNLDKCTAKLNIFATLDNRALAPNDRQKNEDRLEYGERSIRKMARIIRRCLTGNYSLGGAADSSFPPKIEYLTAEGYEDLHAAVITLDVEVFVARKDAGDYPTIATIDMKMEIEGGL